MKNKTILITGGTGSLGRALLNRLLEAGNNVIVYSRDEGKQALLKGILNLKCVIGDIRDLNKLKTTCRLHRPDYIIHAAALKRIEDMEFYPDECVKTNIQGSENVAIAALSSGVKKCILVSTDKACQPVNVYGSTKFIAERIFTNYDYNSSSTIFASVRYGNVIASRGSFIPTWLGMLARGDKLTVTSTEMSRFMFTLDDAVETVLGALESAEGGEVFIPQISSYKMTTIISAIQEIHGSHFDYEIVGLRPGEKLHEDMLAKTELPYTSQVKGKNLLCVKPQYSRRIHTERIAYAGTEFNSALHCTDDVKALVGLINRGLQETS